jgi:hypothetical protein
MKVEFEPGTERVACGCRVYLSDDARARGIEFCSAHSMGFNVLTRDHVGTRSYQERLNAVRTAYQIADACCNGSDQRTVQLPSDCWRTLASEIRTLIGE